MQNILIGTNSSKGILVFLIGFTPDKDTVSQKLYKHFDKNDRMVVICKDASLQSVLNTVSKLNLDVLVDLLGYTCSNFLDVWQTRPAFCQIQYLGFACPTYSPSAFDFVLCGPHALDPKQKADTERKKDCMLSL